MQLRFVELLVLVNVKRIEDFLSQIAQSQVVQLVVFELHRKLIQFCLPIADKSQLCLLVVS